MAKQFVVFSDLDATLLDHNNYSFAAANEALAKLKALDIPLILNSSKTKPEMNQIRAKLDNQHPFIVENGAALMIPQNYFADVNEEVINFSTEYATILQTLEMLREKGFKFRNFDVLSAQDVSDKGGRFYHVIGLFDKGQAIDKSRGFFEQKYPNKEIVTIGLGDSPNDLPMLETVDIAIVVKSGRSAEMKLNNTNAIFSTQEGPAGWNEEILKLLAQQGV